MSRIEELPADFDESLDLNASPPAPPHQSGLPSAAPISSTPFPIPAKARDQYDSTPMLPPHMESVRSHTADEIVKMMNQTPLFMTSLENADLADGENVGLEAIRALQYEGSRAEVARGFKERGNEMVKEKRWKDAKEFYTQGLGALSPKVDASKKATVNEEKADAKPASEEEMETERSEEEKVEEALYVNRALCNLELKNYRSTTLDCASTLRLNPQNIKAYYRSSLALLALDKLREAFDTCTRGLTIEPENTALKSLLSDKLQPREAELRARTQKQTAQLERTRQENLVLAAALRARGIRTRTTAHPPDMEDASIHLSPDPLSPQSTLVFPVILLYPLHAQSDFIKAFPEQDTLAQHLEYIFPLPWDTAHEYSIGNVEFYMETVGGGLIKVARNMSLLAVMGAGKAAEVEVVDGVVRVNVLVKGRAGMWIEEVRARRGRSQGR